MRAEFDSVCDGTVCPQAAPLSECHSAFSKQAPRSWDVRRRKLCFTRIPVTCNASLKRTHVTQNLVYLPDIDPVPTRHLKSFSQSIIYTTCLHHHPCRNRLPHCRPRRPISRSLRPRCHQTQHPLVQLKFRQGRMCSTHVSSGCRSRETGSTIHRKLSGTPSKTKLCGS